MFSNPPPMIHIGLLLPNIVKCVHIGILGIPSCSSMHPKLMRGSHQAKNFKLKDYNQIQGKINYTVKMSSNTKLKTYQNSMKHLDKNIHQSKRKCPNKNR